MTVPVPSWWGVGLAVLLVAVTGAVVVRERLGFGRDVVEAAVRAAVQRPVSRASGLRHRL